MSIKKLTDPMTGESLPVKPEKGIDLMKALVKSLNSATPEIPDKEPLGGNMSNRMGIYKSLVASGFSDLEAWSTAYPKPKGACGWFWMTDYGPAFCDQGESHETKHRCWGSNGAITSPVKPMDPEDQRTWRAIAESLGEGRFGGDGDSRTSERVPREELTK